MLTRDCQIEVNMFLPKLSALIFFIFAKSSHTESLALSSLNITEVTLMRCNSTQTAYAPVMLVKNPTFPDAVENRSIYCVYKFIAPVNHHVEARVVSLSTKGSFNTSRCGNTDYLRIWDGLNDWTWKPSEFCGQHENTIINVTRIASGREMKIEFQAKRYSSQTHYRVEVRFVKSEVDHLMVGRTYGGYMDVDGLAPKSLCNWNVHVERCKGYCELTSPGYPGIYPPLATCNYKIVNREGERVALYLSGTSSGTGRFDLKRSHECREDRVTVYDGETIMDPIIGIFCGEMSVPAVFSTGSALLVEFRSFAGLSPWHYTGFQARAGYKSTAEFKTGMPEMGSLCNWEFSSSIDLAGSIHTPDTYVHYNDTIKCEYSFFGKQEEVVELEIIMPVLRFSACKK
ncbi:tolloid-like protein 1 isoform X2 [Watersipora subatra]|uniref:tolloid-like protein 1 isoform X2 n=1 Tax=Watersipora subatra TaxID=2589382 RepID=UPI00355B8784